MDDLTKSVDGSNTPEGGDEPYTQLLLAQQRSRKRSLRGLTILMTGLVILILITLLLTNCGSGRLADGAKSKRPVIESVSGMTPIPGAVSLWLEPGTSLSAVLAGANVTSDSSIGLDGDRYVIQVEAGTEKSVANTLAGAAGVYDAGLVYQQPDAKE